jgi:hypothetical protein
LLACPYKIPKAKSHCWHAHTLLSYLLQHTSFRFQREHTQLRQL